MLVHGDAAFAGQGVVAETLNLSQLDGYATGGTIHLIINNQIGFTTLPDESRSTPYSTDIARGVQAPIFHVNGDSPQAAIRVVQMAFDYRQQFKKDVVIDMVCYRRHGHNEGDDPSYTQPILYRKIKEHPSVATLYAERLIRERVVFADEVQQMRKAVSQRLSDAYDAVQKQAEHYEVQELSAVPSEDIGSFCPRTSVNQQVLERVIRGMTQFPRELPSASQAARLCREAARGDREERRGRLGVRRGAGVRDAGAGRHARCGSAARIRAAARSASGTWRSTIRRRASATSRCSTSRPTRRASTSTTARSASTRCSASSSATAWPIR